MKKKAYFLIFCLLLSLSACGKSEDVDKKDDSKKAEDLVIDSEEKEKDTGEAEKVQDDSKQGVDKQDEQTTGAVSFKVYYSNDDATAFISEDVQIEALTPENVLQTLIAKGAVAGDVQVLDLETVTVDGKASLELDMNQAFAAYVSNMGTAGEYYVVGSVCNTFLDAYDCEQIKITVEGKTLTTGHAEYPGYMTVFE